MVSEIERTATPWEESKKKVADALRRNLGVDTVKALEWAECLNSFSEEPLEVRIESGKAGVFLKVLGKDFCRIDFTRGTSGESMSVGVKYDDGFLFQDCTARGELTEIEFVDEPDEPDSPSLLFSFKEGKLLGITKVKAEKTLQIWTRYVGKVDRT